MAGLPDGQDTVEYRMANRQFEDARLAEAEAKAQALDIEHHLGRRKHVQEKGEETPFYAPGLARELDVAEAFVAGLKWQPQQPGPKQSWEQPAEGEEQVGEATEGERS